MSLSETVSSRRSELVAVATAMIEDRLNLIEGARKICALRHQVGDPENEVFMPLRAIDSETDHFPLGEMRSHCAADYIQEVDVEINRYLAAARQDILLACREIVHVFSSGASERAKGKNSPLCGPRESGESGV